MDFEEEVGVVTEAIGHAFDDFYLVVNTLDEVGTERILAVGEDARQVGSEVSSEATQGLDPAPQRLAVKSPATMRGIRMPAPPCPAHRPRMHPEPGGNVLPADALFP